MAILHNTILIVLCILSHLLLFLRLKNNYRENIISSRNLYRHNDGNILFKKSKYQVKFYNLLLCECMSTDISPHPFVSAF